MPFLEHMERGLGLQMELRLYGDGDCTKDFAEWIDVPVEGFGDRVNVGVSFESACVLTTLNKLYPSYINGVFQHDGARDWMIEAVSKAFPDGRPIRLSRQTADSIREQATADMRAICDRYFNGRQVFDRYYNEGAFTDEPDLIDISRLDRQVLAEGMLRSLQFLALRGTHHHGREGELSERLRVIKQIARGISAK